MTNDYPVHRTCLRCLSGVWHSSRPGGGGLGTTKMHKDPETWLGAQSEGTNYSVYSFLLSVVTIITTLVTYNRNLLSLSYRGQESEIQVLAGPPPSKDSTGDSFLASSSSCGSLAYGGTSPASASSRGLNLCPCPTLCPVLSV